MHCKKDIVIYNEKEYRALEIIKILGLSRALYYRNRDLGLSPQEAFISIIKNKEKKEQRGNLKPIEIAKKNNISIHAIYKGLYRGLSVEDITKKQQANKIKEKENLEYLRKIGLPDEYDNLNDFCVNERLSIRLVDYYIKNGWNLYDAVLNSLNLKKVSNKISKYCIYGVQLNAIALKNSLDINSIRALIRRGFDYEDAIERVVFANVFAKNLGSKFNILWNIYHNEFLNNIDIKTKVSSEELDNFIIIYNIITHIKKELIYYQFLENINIDKFRLLDLDTRVKIALKTDNMLFTLSELYYILDFENGLMKEFLYIKEYGMWVYKCNRDVLKKIKKIT